MKISEVQDDAAVATLTGGSLGALGQTPVLRVGSKGDAVKKLQLQLISLGYPIGVADGVFGAKTEAAVRAVQMKLGVRVDGIYGPETEAKLLAVNKGGVVDATPKDVATVQQTTTPTPQPKTVTVTNVNPLPGQPGGPVLSIAPQVAPGSSAGSMVSASGGSFGDKLMARVKELMQHPYAPWVLGGAAVLTIGAVWFFSQPKRSSKMSEVESFDGLGTPKKKRKKRKAKKAVEVKEG